MEKFIEAVKLYPFLWNPNDVYFRDIVKKDAAWERIAKECGLVNGKDAKTQWKKLRDSHREALRRRKTASVQILRPWKYEAVMEFLLHSKENTERENITNVPTATLLDNHNDTQNSSDMESTPSPPRSPHPSASYIENRNRKQRILETSMSNDTTRGTHDALASLFESLCQKTRELPKYLQLRVQREIFESVTRAEEEAMTLDPLNTFYTSPSSRNSNIHETSSFPDPSRDTKHLPEYTNRS